MLTTTVHYASIYSYAFTYYYAQNYASIIHQGLVSTFQRLVSSRIEAKLFSI